MMSAASPKFAIGLDSFGLLFLPPRGLHPAHVLRARAIKRCRGSFEDGRIMPTNRTTQADRGLLIDNIHTAVRAYIEIGNGKAIAIGALDILPREGMEFDLVIRCIFRSRLATTSRGIKGESGGPYRTRTYDQLIFLEHRTISFFNTLAWSIFWEILRRSWRVSE